MPTDSSAQLVDIELEHTTEGDVLLHVSGELDGLTSPALHTAITDGLTGRPRQMLVDLSGVGFLGTSGIAVLVRARTSAAEQGAALVLVCTSAMVRRPLELTGLLDLFTVHDSLAEARRPTSGG